MYKLLILVVFLVGCDASSNNTITYRFDETIPYSQWQQAAAMETVSNVLDTNYDIERGCTITFMYHTALMHKWGDVISIRDPLAVSHWDSKTGKCGVDFSLKHFKERDFEKFEGVLLHEIGHLWGLHHSSDRASAMYPEYYSNQVFLPEDQIQLAREKANGKFR